VKNESAINIGGPAGCKGSRGQGIEKRMEAHGDAHENRRIYLFESVIWGDHAETIKDR